MISGVMRDLKNRLSARVRIARTGESDVDADSGEIMARVRRLEVPNPDVPDPGLLELARRGMARLGEANRPDLYPAMPPVLEPGAVFELLDAERGPT